MSAAFARARAVFLAALGIVAAGSVSPATADQSVPVPRVVIYPGDIIADAMLEERVLKLGREPAKVWHLDRAQLVGRIARHSLLPGQAVALGATKARDLVHVGKPVTIVFASGQMTILGGGLAMQGGRPGDTISVQSQDSGVVVRGVIAPDGTVRLGD